MAKITLGGEEREGDLALFLKSEAAWPHIQAVQRQGDSMAVMGALLAFASIAINPATDDPAQIAANLKALRAVARSDEMPGLTPFFNEVLKAGGMAEEPEAGEGQPAGEAASPSTATSTASTPS